MRVLTSARRDPVIADPKVAVAATVGHAMAAAPKVVADRKAAVDAVQTVALAIVVQEIVVRKVAGAGRKGGTSIAA